jgi:MbtH protein
MEKIEESAQGDQDIEAIEQFIVVVNHEEQYSIWPDYKEIPLGWNDVGVAGSKDDCLKYIDEVWKDITPLSVRNRIAEFRAKKES